MTQLPKIIELLGFPLPDEVNEVRWSNKFYRIKNTQEYRLASNMSPWYFPIMDLTIKKCDDGIWRLLHDGDFPPHFIHKNGPDQQSPVGEWTYGSQVFAWSK